MPQEDNKFIAAALNRLWKYTFLHLDKGVFSNEFITLFNL